MNTAILTVKVKRNWGTGVCSEKDTGFPFHMPLLYASSHCLVKTDEAQHSLVHQ